MVSLGLISTCLFSPSRCHLRDSASGGGVTDQIPAHLRQPGPAVFPLAECVRAAAAVTKYRQQGGLNNKNLLSQFSGWKFKKIKVLARLILTEGCEGGPGPRLSPHFWWPRAFCGLQILLLCCHLIFPVCVPVSVSKFPLLIRTPVIGK